MKYKRGSNQHQKKTSYEEMYKSVIYVLIFMIVVFLVGSKYKAYKDSLIISPLSENPVIPHVYAAEEIISTKVSPEDIKRYVKTIFGRDWRVAWAISQSECNKKRKEYPYCIKNDKIEHSVGIFQINLRAHYEKIPGKTYEEKQNYILDPYKNVLLAKSIYADSGWYPWSTYESGVYKTQMP